jgi:RNA polymerase sigma factor (sigma-70 family)
VRLSTERVQGGIVKQAAQRTNPDEWRIVDDLYPALRRFAAVTAPADLEPDDLVQEALVNVLKRHSLSDLDHPGAYLRKTMVNLAASHYRRRGAERRALLRVASSHDLQTDPVYPSDVAELGELPPMQRAALYLAEVEGFRYEEIGQMLGCSRAAARKNASRGRARLRVDVVLEDRR